MRHNNNWFKATILLLLSTILVAPIFGGNPQRAGQTGAELLINPWARSSGWGRQMLQVLEDWKVFECCWYCFTQKTIDF